MKIPRARQSKYNLPFFAAFNPPIRRCDLHPSSERNALEEKERSAARSGRRYLSRWIVPGGGKMVENRRGRTLDRHRGRRGEEDGGIAPAILDREFQRGNNQFYLRFARWGTGGEEERATESISVSAAAAAVASRRIDQSNHEP